MTDIDDTAPDDGEKERKPSQATLLVKLARERFTLVQGDDGRPYAVAKQGHSIARPLRGANGLRKFLARQYAESCGGNAPSQSALADALNVLEGYATDHDPQPVYLRVAPYRDGIALDLGGPDGRCVLIDSHTWVIVDRAPVLFRRTNLTAPLPVPTTGGSVEPYLSLINVDTDRRRALVGWLVSAFLPDIPHAILAVFGEQGTAKSTATKLLMQLVDPSTAPLRSPPREIRQWAVTANASWTVALDNVSDVPPWLSDLLCKAVTGDGHVDRALYSDDDVSVLRFRRVLAINGVSLGALRGDLADRFMPVELEVIDKKSRRSDKRVQQIAEEAYAGALGALLDLLVKVLRELPHVDLAEMPRMADFARVLAAVDKVTGWETLKSYLDAFDGLAETVVSSDPFTDSLRKFADHLTAPWEGETGELLDLIPLPDQKPRDWPKTPQGVGGRLMRSAPALRQLGYTVQPTRKHEKTRRQLWLIAAPEGRAEIEAGKPASEPSQPSEPQVSGGEGLWSQTFAGDSDAAGPKDREDMAPQTFTRSEQGKRAAAKVSKVSKHDPGFLSGSNADDLEAAAHGWWLARDRPRHPNCPDCLAKRPQPRQEKP
ncbi:hypothetical protein [Micromonospora sp. WMMD1274]|uniref:hypothetical protein n=1 Tax=Micromonospora sp. WMMD1274 TaxID=3404116 RepID=UPI003B951572